MTTRREWLKLVAGAAAAASLPRPVRAEASAGAAPDRPYRISLNAYSFNRALTAPSEGKPAAMTLFDVLDFCARLGFDGVDTTGYYFPGYPKLPPDGYVQELKRRAFKLGLDLTGTGVRNNFAQADAAKRAADVQHVKEWIEVAARLGAPVLRVFAGTESPGHPREEAAAWVTAALQECAAHGQQSGVLIGVQNHSDFLRTADHVLDLVHRVDSPWFGVVVDTGHFVIGDPYEQIGRVTPHAVNFQVKESPLGPNSPVRMDLPRLVRAIRSGGYRGYLPIETLESEGKPYDPRAVIPPFYAALRAAAG